MNVQNGPFMEKWSPWIPWTWYVCIQAWLEEPHVILWDESSLAIICSLEPPWFHWWVHYADKKTSRTQEKTWTRPFPGKEKKKSWQLFFFLNRIHILLSTQGLKILKCTIQLHQCKTVWMKDCAYYYKYYQMFLCLSVYSLFCRWKSRVLCFCQSQWRVYHPSHPASMDNFALLFSQTAVAFMRIELTLS